MAGKKRWIGLQASVFAAMALSFTGCAMFPTHQLPEAGPYKPLPDGASKSRATYFFVSAQDMFGEVENDREIAMELEYEFRDVFYQSGYFETFTPDGTGDMSIRARLVNVASPTAVFCVPFVAGLSFTLIPAWATMQNDVTLTVTPPDGKERIYQYTDASRLVFWLPMMFAAPFHDLASVPATIRKNIWKTAVIRMRDEGLFSIPAPPKPVTGAQPGRPHAADQLKNLKELRDKGLLTEEEYNKSRAPLLEKL